MKKYRLLGGTCNVVDVNVLNEYNVVKEKTMAPYEKDYNDSLIFVGAGYDYANSSVITCTSTSAIEWKVRSVDNREGKYIIDYVWI